MINKTEKEKSHPRCTSRSHHHLQNPQQHHQHSKASSGHQSYDRAAPEFPQEMHLTNPQYQVLNLTQNTLKKLIQMNQNYLAEKVKISDVPTPPKYSHKIPSKTGQSEYFLNYGPNSRGKSLPQRSTCPQRTGNLFNANCSPITGYQSTYNLDYAKKAIAGSGNKIEKTKSSYERPVGPTFNQTSYEHDYRGVVPSPTTSAKRMEVKLMGGGKLSDDTTYKKYYRLKTDHFKAPQPIIHKDNRIFLTLNQPPQPTNYRETFNDSISKRKNNQPNDNCKPKQKYSPMPNKLKYRTQYSEEFVKQAIQQKKDFECLSPQQLKSYVMKILND